MKVNGVIQRKLALLDVQVVKLHEMLEGVSYGEFAESWTYRSASERALQVACEIMIDVAERIISLQQAGPVASATEAMDKLVSLQVIPNADPFRHMVRFRNFIVHQYEEIDPEILFSLATRRLKDFQLYRDMIDQWNADDEKHKKVPKGI